MNNSIIDTAVKTIELEASETLKLKDRITEDFSKAVQMIINSNGRVVITGIGKSAIIAQKIVATLNSTGTPSIFMHAADAIHGDLGNIQKNDVVICISKSGNTPEIAALVPLIKAMGNQIIALTGNLKGQLALSADFILDATVDKEACPNNLAPTTSTTTQMVLGDALAVTLMNERGFSSEDFAKYHPGGALGKKLYIKVSDLIAKNEIPRIHKEATLKEVIVEISSKRLGATVVIDKDQLIGVITDGDIRRALEKSNNLSELSAAEIMTINPKYVRNNDLATKAFNIMEEHNITQLVVLDENENYKGIVHIHDILKEGIF